MRVWNANTVAVSTTSTPLGVVRMHLSLDILVLFRSSPLAPLPLLVCQKSEEVIGEGRRREGPRSIIAGTVWKSMRPTLSETDEGRHTA